MAADPSTSAEAVEHIQVGLAPRLGPCDYAYVLAKLSFAIEGGTCVPAEPEPLQGDFRDKSLEPRLQPGSDFFASKLATDFIVRGSAHAPGQPVERMEISTQVGNILKRIAVFGSRPVQWEASGKPRFGAPEPFTEMELCNENLYGGVDWRVPLDENDPKIANYALDVDHPGLYPRNQFGKGYLVVEEPIDDIELPNFEDPDDLLTPDRLLTRDPRLWWRQPLPWTFDCTIASAFPRCALFMPNCDAWFEGPEDESMPEVARGALPVSYRTLMESRETPHPWFYQEASTGLALRGLGGGIPVQIRGMRVGGQDCSFTLPAAPSIEFQVEGRRSLLQPTLNLVICHPADGKLTMTWSAIARDLGRIFIPGIHKYIDISTRVNGGLPVQYQPPPTQKDRIREGLERMARERASAAAASAELPEEEPPPGA